MTRKMISRAVFTLLLILGWVSSVTASSKCYITFDTNEKKSSFLAILNNPTNEILNRSYFPNFTDVLPLTFDEKGKFYPYKEGKRKYIGALLHSEIGRNILESFWMGSGSRLIGIVPNNNYYFFAMAKIASEKDYVVSNIFCFDLDSDYHLGDTKVILWSDLPVTVQNSIKGCLQSYLPQMEVNASVNYVIDELDIDKRNQKTPVYDSSVYEAAQIDFNRREDERFRSLKTSSKAISKEATSENGDGEKGLREFFKKWGVLDKYESYEKKKK